MIEGLIDVVELNGDLVDYISLEGTLLPIGPKGDKGDKGDDGFSPQVDITKVGKATTLTIVDQQGTHQSVIYDGDGDMNKSVYDTDNDGIVDNAERVNNHTVLSDVPSDAQFTDTTYTAGTGIEITAGNVINNTQTSAEWGNITGDIEDQTDLQTALSGKANTGDIPTATSDLDNDSGFITNTVNDLVNYYTTSNTYTKTEVNNLIGQINQFKIEVVQTLPVSDIDTHTIYLVPKTGSTGDVYDEYLYINNAWELIGSTSVDLTNYPTFTDYPTAGGKAGVIKNGFGMTIGSTSGIPSADVYTFYDYNNRDDHIFVSKGTLDNVLTGKDYATNSALSNKQDTLVSGANIKTLNNTSLLGSGNISLHGITVLTYGTSTWSDLTTAYDNGDMIYVINGSRICPLAYYVSGGSGSADFTYYRSIARHTNTAQCDEIIIYHLVPNGTWTTTTRQVSTFVEVGSNTGLTSDYTPVENGKSKITLNVNRATSVSSSSTDAQIPTAKCVYDNLQTKQATLVSGTNIKTINNESLLGSGNITLSADDEVAIQTTEPTGNEKVWINPSLTTNQGKYYYNNAWQDLSIKALDSMPLGSIILFAGTDIPTGWMLCDGTSLSEEEYPELYDVIGHTYGGSGLDFMLPNFKGRVPVGINIQDTDFDTLGETGGSKELQQHTHNNRMNTLNKLDNSYGLSGGGAYPDRVVIRQNDDNTNVLNDFVNIQSAGTGNSGNLQPYLVVNYIIKVSNTTPTMASIVDAYSTSTQDGYSCSYVNKLSTYPSTSAGEIVIGQTSDGTPVYRKTLYITQQNQAHGISNLFAVISTNAILNSFDYGWVNVSYDVVIQASNVWLRDRALSNVGNGILLTIEYYKSS